MTAKKDPHLSQPLDGRGPGAHLREAREKTGMTVDKVATALLLHPAVVEALEVDAYDRLPAPTFVRGYLRGYARLLGLPAGPVLDMYDRHGFEPPPLTSDTTETPQAHTSDIPIRLVTYAVAGILALLVGLWWHSQEDGGFGISAGLFDRSPGTPADSSPPSSEESGVATTDGESAGEAIAMATEPPSEPPRDPGSPSPSVTEGGAPANVPATAAGVVAGDPASTDSTEPGAVSLDEEPAIPDSVDGATTSADTEVAGSAPADAPEPGADTAAEPGAPPSAAASATSAISSEPPATLATPRSGLVLEFAHESWVEIYDGERTRLFFGLAAPGRVLGFDGAQPFDVLLGYGKDVRVTIDGEAFDHTPYMRHGVARFSIGSETGNDAVSAAPTDDAPTASPRDDP